MAVFSGNNEYLGRITDIIPTGANDVYVVNADDNGETGSTDGSPKEILIPALASVVLDVDIKQRTMRVKLPEGLDELR